MTQRFGIDTSVLVRLITGNPKNDFMHCVSELRSLIEDQGVEVFASNQVVGETYVAVQHHYGVSSADARASLLGCASQRSGSPPERPVRRRGP